MGDEFDELQQMIDEDMRKVYSEAVIDHFHNPRNVGEIPHPDGYARITGPCGDTMAIWLRVRDDNIIDAKFWTDGCGPSIASGSMTTELAKGKRLSDALRIDKEYVLNRLGGLPDESVHCALLASNTLKAAIRDFISLKNAPWKRAYKIH